MEDLGHTSAARCLTAVFMADSTFTDQVELALQALRPAIAADGGGIELVEAEELTGLVKLKLLGACAHCSLATITLQLGVERELKRRLPQVRQVVAVNMPSLEDLLSGAKPKAD